MEALDPLKRRLGYVINANQIARARAQQNVHAENMNLLYLEQQELERHLIIMQQFLQAIVAMLGEILGVFQIFLE